LADFPSGADFFGSLLVETLTWTAQLVLTTQIHQHEVVGGTIAREQLATTYERCRQIVPLEDSFDDVVGAWERAGLIVRDGDAYRWPRDLRYDAERKDYIVL
jgi:hypothetical protein